MNRNSTKSNILLLTAAFIWGFAFVAQRVGMDYIGAFTYNAVRFALGSIAIIPIIIFFKKDDEREIKVPSNRIYLYGVIAGIFIFAGSSLQQVGLIGTPAGKAAFITGLYIVIVPILGVFLKHKIGLNSWIGAIIAVFGLYILSVGSDFSIANSDLLELAGAFFFALHILVIDYFSARVNSIKLAFIQYVTCSILSFIVAFASEKIDLQSIGMAAIPIIYGGVFSVGIAYTLQILGQKGAKPTHAAIILSMESVFASIGGFLILQENLGARGLAGCGLMLVGMICSQINFSRKGKLQGQEKKSA
ncbi:DMT family transporter [Clostridium sp. 19966]|uniref:DMT family transporter n=1 Tax=Clostridium sp. 19966 TaxID=2768166 RepID=UPI0028DE16BE|nr:DMT family transporter [Clostridium sp. 19966]MDT8719405.1 DMT family transporter [Clostridium sp. 19966]